MSVMRVYNFSSHTLISDCAGMLRGIMVTAMLLLAMLLQGCAGIDGGDASAAKPGVSADLLLTRVQQAEQSYGNEQWSAASTHYQELLELLPDDPYAWFRLGNSLTQQGQYSQAIQAYEKSVSLDASQHKPWFNLSTTHLLGAQVATLKVVESARVSEQSRSEARQRLDVISALLR